jgi:hypothetical protein
MRTKKQQAAAMVSIKKAIATTPWRRWDLVGTRKSAKTAKYIAERRAAGDQPRPLRELDE